MDEILEKIEKDCAFDRKLRKVLEENGLYEEYLERLFKGTLMW